MLLHSLKVRHHRNRLFFFFYKNKSLVGCVELIAMDTSIPLLFDCRIVSADVSTMTEDGAPALLCASAFSQNLSASSSNELLLNKLCVGAFSLALQLTRGMLLQDLVGDTSNALASASSGCSAVSAEVVEYKLDGGAVCHIGLMPLSTSSSFREKEEPLLLMVRQSLQVRRACSLSSNRNLIFQSLVAVVQNAVERLRGDGGVERARLPAPQSLSKLLRDPLLARAVADDVQSFLSGFASTFTQSGAPTNFQQSAAAQQLHLVLSAPDAIREASEHDDNAHNVDAVVRHCVSSAKQSIALTSSVVCLGVSSAVPVARLIPTDIAVWREDCLLCGVAALKPFVIASLSFALGPTGDGGSAYTVADGTGTSKKTYKFHEPRSTTTTTSAVPMETSIVVVSPESTQPHTVMVALHERYVVAARFVPSAAPFLGTTVEDAAEGLHEAIDELMSEATLRARATPTGRWLLPLVGGRWPRCADGTRFCGEHVIAFEARQFLLAGGPVLCASFLGTGTSLHGCISDIHRPTAEWFHRAETALRGGKSARMPLCTHRRHVPLGRNVSTLFAHATSSILQVHNATHCLFVGGVTMSDDAQHLAVVALLDNTLDHTAATRILNYLLSQSFWTR